MVSVLKIILGILLLFSFLPLAFSQNPSTEDQFIDSEEFKKILDRLDELENQPTFDEEFVNSQEYAKIIERLHSLELMPSFDEQLKENEEFQNNVKQLDELTNQPPFDEELTSSFEFTKILERIQYLENIHYQDRFWIDFQWISLIGIILSIFGFVFVLWFWREPMQGEVEFWKSIQVIIHPKDHADRIKDDWNWFRLPGSDQGDPRGRWLVPKGFGIYWSRGKKISYFLVISGFVLQGIQIFIF